MKRNLLFSLAVLLCAAMMAGLWSCGTDEPTEKVNRLTNHLTFKNVKAHYVDEMIIVDFQVENRTGSDINDLRLDIKDFEPYTGHYAYLSMGQGATWELWSMGNITLARGETRDMRLRIDCTNSATVNKFSISIEGSSVRFGTLDERTVTLSGSVQDTRATSNTIWTNDDLMEYRNWQCMRNGDALTASFVLTNRTGLDITDLLLEMDRYDNGNGNTSLGYAYFIVDDNKDIWNTTITINNGESRTVKIYMPDFFKSTARCFNARLKVSSNHYSFASPYVHLVSLEL